MYLSHDPNQPHKKRLNSNFDSKLPLVIMLPMAICSAITVCCGLLYPAYASFKSLRNNNPEEYVQYLVYWLVYAGYLVFEHLADILLFWLPFYYETKVLLVLWLVLPQTQVSLLSIVRAHLLRVLFTCTMPSSCLPSMHMSTPLTKHWILHFYMHQVTFLN